MIDSNLLPALTLPSQWKGIFLGKEGILRPQAGRDIGKVLQRYLFNANYSR